LNEKCGDIKIMKMIYKRIIGLFMALPGMSMLYLAYTNGAYDVTMAQIILFITGMLISTIITALFFYGAWLLIICPED
jgi:hypothetical protein